MDNALMIGLQTQRVLQRRMDISANNLANISTSGFKADTLVTEEVDNTGAHTEDNPRDVRFVRDLFEMRDMSQGPIAATGNPLDVAIQGDGFFIVQGPAGPLYTRDGAFAISADGHLVTSDGKDVLSQGGAPIIFDAQAGGSPTITRDGAITMDGVEVARLGVVNFANPQAMQKVGENLWNSGGQAQRDFEGVVVQGSVEGSNVSPVLELTRLIEISRAYESAARIVSSADDLRQRALQRLGQVQ
ncbi:MAG TPA: flagellar basal-body rod protein FlgF [Caulobacterales bacterium]|nr:flagellar basal-body rod protein FlgF [Caulobacterales bacterium]